MKRLFIVLGLCAVLAAFPTMGSAACGRTPVSDAEALVVVRPGSWTFSSWFEGLRECAFLTSNDWVNLQYQDFFANFQVDNPTAEEWRVKHFTSNPALPDWAPTAFSTGHFGEVWFKYLRSGSAVAFNYPELLRPEHRNRPANPDGDCPTYDGGLFNNLDGWGWAVVDAAGVHWNGAWRGSTSTDSFASWTGTENFNINEMGVQAVGTAVGTGNRVDVDFTLTADIPEANVNVVNEHVVGYVTWAFSADGLEFTAVLTEPSAESFSDCLPAGTYATMVQEFFPNPSTTLVNRFLHNVKDNMVKAGRKTLTQPALVK